VTKNNSSNLVLDSTNFINHMSFGKLFIPYNVTFFRLANKSSLIFAFRLSSSMSSSLSGSSISSYAESSSYSSFLLVISTYIIRK
jgi:hypothetical protein